MHRAGPHRAGRRLRDEAAGERAPTRSGLLVGYTGVHRPPQRATEQDGLLDGLGRADVMQLRGPVRSAHDERHPGQMSLHDSRVNPDRRRPARRDEHRRPACRKPDPEGEEGRRALVQAYVQCHPALTRERHHERGGTRARGHDGIGQPGAHPLVDERGREASRYRHRRCPSRTASRRGRDRPHCTRQEGDTDRGSSSSTGSPRRALLGRASPESSKVTSRS